MQDCKRGLGLVYESPVHVALIYCKAPSHDIFIHCLLAARKANNVFT